MSDDWRDHEAGRTGVSVGQLSDGETVTVEAVSEPFRRDTEEAEDALHVPVIVHEAPDGFADMSGDDIETADDSEDPAEYNIINSSAGFFESLVNEFPEGVAVAGSVFDITARQPDDSFSRYYEIDW